MVGQGGVWRGGGGGNEGGVGVGVGCGGGVGGVWRGSRAGSGLGVAVPYAGAGDGVDVEGVELVLGLLDVVDVVRQVAVCQCVS
jgi:hypothetical protein